MSGYKNPIESGIETVDITSHFVDAVGEKDFRAIKAIFQWLKEKGYQAPILYGGALRDAYIGEHLPNDYDIDVLNNMPRTRLRLGREPNVIKLDISGRVQSRPDDTMHDIALRADAPINGVAMNRKGRIVAHPSFTEHAQGKIYQIRRDMNASQRYFAELRFERLRARYSDLRNQ